MWNKKSIENRPKNKNVVISLHTCPCTNIRLKLKYKLNGDIISIAHAAVVKNADVMYNRDITGISIYLCYFWFLNMLMILFAVRIVVLYCFISH